MRVLWRFSTLFLPDCLARRYSTSNPQFIYILDSSLKYRRVKNFADNWCLKWCLYSFFTYYLIFKNFCNYFVQFLHFIRLLYLFGEDFETDALYWSKLSYMHMILANLCMLCFCSGKFIYAFMYEYSRTYTHQVSNRYGAPWFTFNTGLTILRP